MRLIIKVNFLVILILTSSCSFKKSFDPKTVPSFSITSKFDWNSPTNRRDDYLVKAQRQLVLKDVSEASSDVPVTLPIDIPNPITIQNEDPSNLMSNFIFSKGYAITNGKSIELPVQVRLNDGKITLQIDGLTAAFSQEKSEVCLLRVELYGSSAKLFTYSYVLRTPPSDLISDTKNIAELGDLERSTLATGLVSPIIQGSEFTLVEVVTLKNNETIPVEVVVPTTLTGRLHQSVTTKAYTDRECHGGDFYYSSTNWEDTVSRELYLVPIDQNIYMNLSNQESNHAEPSERNIRIEADGSYNFAIYAKGNIVRSWANRSGANGTVSIQHVPAGCYTERGDCEERAGDHGGSVCQSITKRTYQDIPIGDERGAMQLHLDTITVKARYYDTDQFKDSGFREIAILAQDHLIERP